MTCLCGEARRESSPGPLPPAGGWRALQEAEQSSTNYELKIHFESQLFCPLISISGGGSADALGKTAQADFCPQ